MSRSDTHLPGQADHPGSEGAKQWLLYAGRAPKATTNSPVAVFSDEARARRAFLDQRLRSADPEAWAQLVAVERDGGMRPTSWFGPAPIIGDDRAARESSHRTLPSAVGRKRRGRRRSVAAGGWQ